MKSNPIKKRMETKKAFTTIDLFAGVGGMRLGFEQAGFKKNQAVSGGEKSNGK